MGAVAGGGAGAGAGAAVAAGGAGRAAPGGRANCLTGTLTSGILGLLVLTLNSTCWPGGTINPCGNASWAVKDLPACISRISVPTPGTLTAGSDSVRRFVALLFWIATEIDSGLASGPGGRLMTLGVAITAGWTLATSGTVMLGVLDHEVF